MNEKMLFDRAFDFAYKHEVGHVKNGGFVNNPADPGGATKYGISLRFLKLNNIDINEDGKINIDDIKALDYCDVKTLFYNEFWRPMNCHLILHDNLVIKLFDFGVNMGLVRAVILLQKSVNKYIRDNSGQFKTIKPLKVDGLIGIKTSSLVNICPEPALMNNLVLYAIDFYHSIKNSNPENYKAHIKGWLNRANDFDFN